MREACIAPVEVYAAKPVLQGKVVVVVEDDAIAKARLNLFYPPCQLLFRRFRLSQVEPPRAVDH